MLSSSWSVRLPHPPEGDLARPIDLGGDAWCLVYQTVGKRMFVHEKNVSKPFPFQKEATCLEVYSDRNGSAVAVLCNNMLSSFDLVNNREHFSVEFEAATLLEASNQNLFVAGLASLHCLDFTGSELWSTHLSGNVMCMRASTEGYLFLGLEDRSIKIFLKDQMLNDYSNLASMPVCFCPIEKFSVMVGFKEGLVTVYQSKKPKWKAKSKHIPKQILLHTIETQKEKTAIVARQDGQIELRSWIDGTIFSKTATDEPICRMFILDYRKEKEEQLVVLSKSGTLRGYSMQEKVEQPKVMLGAQRDELLQKVASLQNAKLDLQMEIEQLKKEASRPAEPTAEILRSDFQLKLRLDCKQKVQLKIICENGLARGIVFEEALKPFYQKSSEKLTYELSADCEYFGVVHAQVLVSSYPSNEFQLYPVEFELKRFWKWLPVQGGDSPPPETCVMFKHPERIARYVKWLGQCFHLGLAEPQFEQLQEQSKISLAFTNCHDKTLLVIKADSSNSIASFHCENLQLLSQLVQDFAEYMNIKELEVDGKFPKETTQLRQKLSQIEQLSKNKTNISSEIADAINGIKSMVVRGENARMLGRMGDVRRTYTEIMEQNHKICLEIEKRSRNAGTLNELLRYVGQMITLSAGMRIGSARTRVNTLCRNALKNKHFLSIADIMEKGFE